MKKSDSSKAKSNKRLGADSEVARFAAIEGKTCNYPVIASGKLVVRTANWMAAYNIGAPRHHHLTQLLWTISIPIDPTAFSSN